MKKLVTLSLLLVFALTMVACNGEPSPATKSDSSMQSKPAASATAEGSRQSSDESTADPALQEIKKKGKLGLATSADYPPYEWHLMQNGKDEIVGFDIEIARSLAKSIGVELEIKDLDFDAIVPSITSGQADIGIAGLSVTKERLESVNMTQPYFQNKQIILVNKSAAGQYKKLEDFKGKTVGAQTGSIQETTVHEKFPPEVKVKSLAKLNNLVIEVLNGTADGLVIAKSSGEQYVKLFPDLVALDITLPDEPGVCIALKKGNDALTTYFNRELQKLIDTGKVKEWISQYEKISADAAAATK